MPQPVRQQVIYLQLLAPPKPALGQPCNGCGLCCLAEPCPLGMLISRRRSGACAALVWREREQRYDCAAAHLAEPLVRRRLPRWMGPWRRTLAQLARRWALRAIAAGQGCDAQMQAQALDRTPAGDGP